MSTAAVDRAGRAERYDIVAVASSAGGISALGHLLESLSADLPVPLLIVQHLDPRRQTMIAGVLGRRSHLPVKLAEPNENAQPGIVYVAPPDHHLLVAAHGLLTLTSSELVHFVRPSADLLFESVAGAYGSRAVACVLTGSGTDGAMGLSAVKARGGLAIVQDAQSAEFKGMPEAAVRTGVVDVVLPLEEIGPTLNRIAQIGRHP